MGKDFEELNQLSEKVIGAAYTVSNTLGSGFLEKVYENAMFIELRKQGMAVEQQLPIKVYYDGIVVGDYIADLVVEDTIILELKACKGLDKFHESQCLNYLHATNLPLALLMNFGRPKVEVKRFAN